MIKSGPHYDNVWLRGSIAPHIRWRCVVGFTSQLLYHLGEPLYPLKQNSGWFRAGLDMLVKK
jgi:hypothetical protein